MNAIVTGASGGIGSAIAFALADMGHSVAVCYNSDEKSAESIAKRINDEGGEAKSYKLDVCSTLSADDVIKSVRSDFGDIGILINNAGVASQELITDVTDECYDRIMDVNLKGAFRMIRAVLPDMIKNKKGIIVNVSSMWGETGASCEVVYSASKAGLIGMTKALAKEVGPSGIRVNCVSPGVIDTKMNAGHSEDTIAELCDETPLMRIGTPEEVAETVAFLCSDSSSFITGQDIGVSGGMVI